MARTLLLWPATARFLAGDGGHNRSGPPHATQQRTPNGARRKQTPATPLGKVTNIRYVL
jgi:hypothetical protein